MDTPSPTCAARGCDKPARMAIRTTRPHGNLVTAVYFDNRAEKVPKVAIRYCKACGSGVLADLCAVMVDADD